MFHIQSTNRIHGICGMDRDGKVRKVENLWCVRKHMCPSHLEWKTLKQTKTDNIFAFVSSPKMHKQQMTILANIKAWCHPFRDVHQYLTDKKCKYAMLPESDFLDADFVQMGTNNPKYDFFYLTLNAKSGISYKGLDNFISLLPCLCGKIKLRGIVLVYFPARGSSKHFSVLTKNQRNLIDKYSSQLDFMWGWKKQSEMESIMSSARFGIFPNEVDCSPRVIPESLLRNRPVLVNKDIWGGWHYVQDETGSFFDPNDENTVLAAVDNLLLQKFSTRDYFMEHYGFSKSTKKLADFLSGVYPQLENFTNVYFKKYATYMEKIIDKN